MLIFADIRRYSHLLLVHRSHPNGDEDTFSIVVVCVHVLRGGHRVFGEARKRTGGFSEERRGQKGLGEKWVLVLRAIRRSKREATVDWWAYTAKRCTSTPKYILVNVEISTLEWRG